MGKRRLFIFILFFVIAVFATSRTLLLSRSVQQEQKCIQTEKTESPGKIQTLCGKLLDGLILVSVSLPFFITAFILVLYTMQDE